MSHKTEEELNSLLEEARSKVSVGSKYYHYKNPDNQYVLIDVAIFEGDESVCVIYRPLYMASNVLWIRKLEGEGGWLTPAVSENGEQTDRFVKVNE